MLLVLNGQQTRRQLQERKERTKKNSKKRGRVRKIDGIMTREQVSDSALFPDREEGEIETPSPQRSGGRQGYQHPLQGGYMPQPEIASKEVMCSFCGINTHDYKDCPVMHQYIREQADALAQRRLEEYQQLQEWEGYGIPKQTPPHQRPLFRGGAR